MSTRRVWVWFAALAAAGVLAGAAIGAKKKFKTAATEEDFKKLVADLTAEGESYAESGGEGAPAVSKAVTDLEYGPKAAEHLIKALQTPHKQELARLYIAFQLIGPLDNAADVQLRKLRPALLSLFARCRYKPMPSWPKYKLQRLILPDRKMSKEERKRREQTKAKFLTEKVAGERAVTKFNRLASALQKSLKVLLIRMGEKQADEVLLVRLADEEDSMWNTYHNTLEGIRAEAVRMKPEQAKRYYDALRGQMRICREKRHYADPTRPKYSDKENSSFHTQRMWFAQEAARVINLLATSAKEPAVIVPGEKKPGPKRRRKHR